MTTLIVTTRDGTSHKISATMGDTIMEAIRAADIGELLALCGGSCSCATCHVFIEAPEALAFPPMTADENDLLDSSEHRRKTSRLSCQIPVTATMDGLRLVIAPDE